MARLVAVRLLDLAPIRTLNTGTVAKPTPTRTLNPLPFQDLEPQRFEDLVRQLAYDLRRWKSLEAVGRSGSDEGLDIRGVEVAQIDESEDDDDGQDQPASEERSWVFQCKRVKTLSPAEVRTIVDESLCSLPTAPHGFVLALACDVSKRARDAFRAEMVRRGISEFMLWAKGELEDMLFQPKNDRLLFAYFGLSLQPRRRALSTALRSEIVKKKQLTAIIGEDGGRGKLVLLRDPTDERYPDLPQEKGSKPRWLLCRAHHVKTPGHLAVLRSEHYAATTPDCSGWDALLEHDISKFSAESELASVNAWGVDIRSFRDAVESDFWNEYIAEPDQAYLKVYRFVPLDRILVVDPLGDGYFPVPHIFVDSADTASPFAPGTTYVLERPAYSSGQVIDLVPSKKNRVSIIPNPLPGKVGAPLAGFDDTRDQAVPLSDQVQQKLEVLLSINRPIANAPEQENSSERRQRSLEKLKPFEEWQNSVALPVFSAVVTKLRSQGHGGRAVTRSVPPSDRHGGGSASVELRVQLHVGSGFNPAYRAKGHLRFSWSDYGGWQMDVSPKPEQPRGNYGAPVPPQPKVEALTKEQLESQVILLIERLKTQDR